MIIAVDFYGTVAMSKRGGKVGSLLPHARRVLHRLADAGHELVLWTCSEGTYLDRVRAFCEAEELPFRWFNWIPSSKRRWSARKLPADLFIDDRTALHMDGFCWLREERLLEGVGVLPCD